MLKTPVKTIIIKTIIVSLIFMAGACSDSGAPARPPTIAIPSTPPPPPTPTGPVWTAGSFEAASRFKDQCEAVRTGLDIEGNPFPDRAGSLVEENFWLRSWTQETYLWNTEVIDRDPATFNDRLAYFDVLRTTAKTASGKDKDDFHFSEPTTEFLRRRNSAPRAGYGARFVAFSTTVPRDYRIQYTDPNTPASAVVNGQVNFLRGAKILEVDGVDLVNDGDTQALNDGLFPAAAGESHTFVVQDAGSTQSRAVTLISANLSQKPVNRMKTIDTPSGKVGYVLFNTFSPFASEEEIADAVSALKTDGITDLILDLRYNGGGLLAVASQLSYMIAGDARTRNKTFEQLRFNAAAGNINPVTGAFNDPVPFYNTGLGFTVSNGIPLDSLSLPRVFILSTGRTCSASEAVINGLRGVDVEVVLIGDTTCGKPFGFYPQDNCGETYYTIQFQGVNEKNFGDYTDGFVPMNSSAAFGVDLPGCAVPDDYDHELGDENETMFAAALQYRATGSCPAIATLQAASKAGSRSDDANAVAITALTPLEEALQNNRDMTLPN